MRVSADDALGLEEVFYNQSLDSKIAGLETVSAVAYDRFPNQFQVCGGRAYVETKLRDGKKPELTAGISVDW